MVWKKLENIGNTYKWYKIIEIQHYAQKYNWYSYKIHKVAKTNWQNNKINILLYQIQNNTEQYKRIQYTGLICRVKEYAHSSLKGKLKMRVN